MTCGVYVITNDMNGRQYVGSSKHVGHRWTEHRSKLRHASHPNNILSADYANGDTFAFALLEECVEEDLARIEAGWVAKICPAYNVTRVDRVCDRRSQRPILTHCKHGHEYTPENTRIDSDGYRSCRTCDKISWQKQHPPRGVTPRITVPEQTVQRLNALSDRCGKGHLFTPENTYWDHRGWRSCATCVSARASAWSKNKRTRRRAIQ